MSQPWHASYIRFATSLGLTALVAGCAQNQNSSLETKAALSSQIMDGCGMMVDGKMVYKKVAPGAQVSPHFFINEFNKLKLSSWPILPRSLRQLEPVRLHKTVFCRFPPTDQALYK